MIIYLDLQDKVKECYILNIKIHKDVLSARIWGILKMPKYNVDNLTGLANSKQFVLSFHDFVQRHMDQCNIFSILVIELEKANQQLEKQSLDLMLSRLAVILSSCLRYQDQVFRYADYKFTVLLNNSDNTSTSHIIERISMSINNDLVLSEFNALCRIGSANYRKGENLTNLCKRAELL